MANRGGVGRSWRLGGVARDGAGPAIGSGRDAQQRPHERAVRQDVRLGEAVAVGVEQVQFGIGARLCGGQHAGSVQQRVPVFQQGAEPLPLKAGTPHSRACRPACRQTVRAGTYPRSELAAISR
jgi:hypothetical protein